MHATCLLDRLTGCTKLSATQDLTRRADSGSMAWILSSGSCACQAWGSWRGICSWYYQGLRCCFRNCH